MDVKITGSEKKLTEDDLRRAESVIGASLPAEYRKFLLQHNGGRPDPADFRINWKDRERLARGWRISTVGDFHSIYDGPALNLLEDFKFYRDRIPKDMLAVARDPGGNAILLGLAGDKRGRVFFWINNLPAEYTETDFANLGFIASGFDEFINSLFTADEP